MIAVSSLNNGGSTIFSLLKQQRSGAVREKEGGRQRSMKEMTLNSSENGPNKLP